MKQFEKQLRAIASQFQFIDAVRFEAIMEGRDRIENDMVLLTFDDGYRSNYEAAHRVLDPMGIKAIFFVPTGFIDCCDPQAQRLFVAEKLFDNCISVGDVPEHVSPMTWNDLAALVSRGHTIGSHGIHHRRAANIGSREELAMELRDSLVRIREQLGTVVKHHAYPFGTIANINASSLKLMQIHYPFVHTGIHGNNTQTYSGHLIFRDAFDATCSCGFISFVLNGGVDGRYASARAKLRSMLGE